MAASPYDGFADGYDERYLSREALAENAAVAELLAGERGPVLDIGCGTGLLLDLLPWLTPDDYDGIDPSPAMLSVLARRHPAFAGRATLGSFEGFTPTRRYGLAAGLFGSPSHVDPPALRRVDGLLAPGGLAFLMFYREGAPASPLRELLRRDPSYAEHFANVADLRGGREVAQRDLGGFKVVTWRQG